MSRDPLCYRDDLDGPRHAGAVNNQVLSHSPKQSRISRKILAPVADTRHARNLLKCVEQLRDPSVRGVSLSLAM
jgi:hypothetical protein